jgi:predicted anti-sigma-YlaC factor YlaD
MHEDILPLLNAYLDGELHGTRLLQVQNHLASCEACRNELKELRRVSDLLQAAPAPEFTPADRFVANLTLSLPRRPLASQPPKPGSLLWWLVPAGLLVAWFFVQTAFTLTNVVTAADAAGLLGNASSFFSSGTDHTLWFNALTGLLGGQSTGTSLSLLDQVSAFGTSLFTSFLVQAAIVLAYWAWLTVWWLRRRPRPMRITASPARS